MMTEVLMGGSKLVGKLCNTLDISLYDDSLLFPVKYLALFFSLFWGFLGMGKR